MEQEISPRAEPRLVIRLYKELESRASPERAPVQIPQKEQNQHALRATTLLHLFGGCGTGLFNWTLMLQYRSFLKRYMGWLPLWR